MRRRQIVVLAALALLGGCGSAPTDSTPVSNAAAPEGFPLASGEPMDDETGASLPPTTWSESSADDAADVAMSALSAWGQTTMDAAAWWEQLAPLLDEAGRAAAAGGPTSATALSVSGCVPDGTESVWVQWISCTTSAGVWGVVVTRQNDDTWLVDRWEMRP